MKARILFASTSEVYGDPAVCESSHCAPHLSLSLSLSSQEHPQTEEYWGNVNTIGPRACYDEGKRVAETMMYAYKKQVQIELTSIFPFCTL